MDRSLEKPQLYDLIVMGASAGGIEALSILVAALPPTLPVPIVIAQHLDPSVPSHLGQILARRSRLPIQTVGEDSHRPEHLRPGTIYVVPADLDVEIADSTVRLQPSAGRHPTPSIDRLFASAATAYGERVIAVILTGSGTDGTAGARAIKAAGGTILIENPQTASYPSMPASLPPTSVDLVVDLEHMGSLIADLISGAHTLTAPPAADTLAGLLEQVRQHTSIDFSLYKTPTILRRLHRRMAATGSGTLTDYIQVIQEHPEEYQHLVTSFLINVTEFFRDPALFVVLRERILPDITSQARSRGASPEVRVWSAGCSTGEEAYSLAILMAEVLGEEAFQFTIRIFATDADADAVIFARRGIYPATALATVPEELRARYFIPVDGGFAVTKSIRQMVTFGEHDLGQRAPLPHIDLVLCHNVLIYFTPELQRRALQLFAFSLRDGGYLVLGNAESISTLPNYFSPVHPPFKIYRRRGERILVPPIPIIDRDLVELETSVPIELARQSKLRVVPNGGTAPAAKDTQNGPSPGLEPGIRVYTAREHFAEQILSLPIGVVVVDRDYDVLTINSAAHALLDMHRPAIGRDLIHLAERVPTRPLRALIDRTFEAEALSSAGPTAVQLQLESGEQVERRVQVVCYPYRRSAHSGEEGSSPTVEAAVLFISELPTTLLSQTTVEMRPTPEAESAKDVPRESSTEVAADTIGHLTRQLEAERQHNRELRLATRELREENDSLRRANEDLLVSKEEVQSSSEETKTLNEEMQATNEELETLNEELEATVEELHTTNDDLIARTQELQATTENKDAQHRVSERQRAQLDAVLGGMGDAMLAVDPVGKHVLLNEAYTTLFENLGPEVVIGDELGQPLPREAAPWERLTEGKTFRMAFTMHEPDGSRKWFEAVGQPISRNELELGAVLTIRDVSDRNMLSVYERFLAQVSHELRQPMTVLLATLQLLQKRWSAADTGAGAGYTDEVDTQLARAVRQARQLNTLIGDLADLERVRRDKLQFKLEPVDMVDLAYRVIDDLALTQPNAQLTPPVVVRAELENAGPILVSGDTNRMEQVLRNLLQNALKYAPESERIDVRLRRVREYHTPVMAEIEVQDYGPGIPARDQPFIFTPFYQVPSANVTRHEGLGLGLYIVQQLVQAHGGNIEVRSPEGRGTIIIIRLPLAAAGSSPIAAARPEALAPPQANDKPRRRKTDPA